MQNVNMIFILKNLFGSSFKINCHGNYIKTLSIEKIFYIIASFLDDVTIFELKNVRML